MKRYLSAALAATCLLSCGKIDTSHWYDSVDFEYGKDLAHDEIVLGDRLENPYKTINIQKAYAALYPTKAREPVETNCLYVRFLPAGQDEYDVLESMGLKLVDHPLDFEILRDGDWYHDATVADGSITWQYCVVDKDFRFPSTIRYELIDECFLTEYAGSTRALPDVDWDAVERLSYQMTGNELPEPVSKADESVRAVPSGRITIVDPKYAGGKPLGVQGVKVVCNSFVKFDVAETDRDGYYRMGKEFSSNVHYRLLFQNGKRFSIGFNFILVPASVSTLGTAGPEGVNLTVTEASETKLWTRCVVNNAACDYLSRADESDLNLPAPPSDIRIWIFNKLTPSCSVMMHHGTIVDQGKIAAMLGYWAGLVKVFAPDITLGTASSSSYADIWASTVHEMAHASHFSKVGKAYWDEYIYYILEAYIRTGSCYGDGRLERAGYCEVGEMWAYFLESKCYQQRYGGQYPAFGTSYWFRPQILRYLDERGLGPSRLMDALEGDVCTKAALRNRLIALYPYQKKVIEQVFNRYN